MADDADARDSEPQSGQTSQGEEVGRRFEAGAMDIAEWKSNFVIRVDLPGIDDGGLSVDVADATLEITATRNGSGDVPIERYLFRERTTERVDRSIALPTDVDAAEMTAEYDSGVLTVVLPQE